MKNTTALKINLPVAEDDPAADLRALIHDINRVWNDMVEHAVTRAVRLGEMLIEAKADADRAGEKWTEKFPSKNRPAGTPGLMPFSYDAAKQYMSIARNAAVRNSEHVHYFPSDTASLYQLARLEPRVIGKLIKDKRIGSHMSRPEVKQLVAELLPPKQPQDKKPLSDLRVGQKLEHDGDALAELLDAEDWNPDPENAATVVPSARRMIALLQTLIAKYEAQQEADQ